MMILSGQGVFLRRLSRLSLSTQGLFELTPLHAVHVTQDQVHSVHFMGYVLDFPGLARHKNAYLE